MSEDGAAEIPISLTPVYLSASRGHLAVSEFLRSWNGENHCNLSSSCFSYTALIQSTAFAIFQAKQGCWILDVPKFPCGGISTTELNHQSRFCP